MTRQKNENKKKFDLTQIISSSFEQSGKNKQNAHQ